MKSDRDVIQLALSFAIEREEHFIDCHSHIADDPAITIARKNIEAFKRIKTNISKQTTKLKAIADDYLNTKGE